MNYRLTILNIASVFLFFGTIIYAIINYSELSEGEGWGVMLMLFFLSVACVGFAIDLFIQFLTKKNKPLIRLLIRNLLGAIVIISAYYLERLNSSELTVFVPNDYTDAVAIVYSVPKAPKLPTNMFTLNSKITLPADGIILTKTSIHYNDIPYTVFMRENGTKVSIPGSWNNLHSDKIPIDCNGKTVIIRISHLGTENGEKKIKEKLEIVREKLKKYCAQQRTELKTK